jgi:hypothetical protein
MESVKAPGNDIRPNAGAQQGKSPMKPATISPRKDKKRSKKPFIIGAVVALSLLAGLHFFNHTRGAGTAPKSDRYQMVYMDDGKVYFGKLKNTEGNYLRLEEAYSVRSPEGGTGTASQSTAANANVSLIKISDLVYGPEGDIMLRAEKVNFWQDLKQDSKVSKAIETAQK